MKISQENVKANEDSVANCEGTVIPVRIESLIYIIRDQQVMLDTHLARLYGVETKVLVSADKGRMFEVTNCDLKQQKGI